MESRPYKRRMTPKLRDVKSNRSLLYVGKTRVSGELSKIPVTAIYKKRPVISLHVQMEGM